MDNTLPTEFDIIIIGTGLVESIISAAASRIGKRVLHVDTNDYYGGTWASFNLKSLQEQGTKPNEKQFENERGLQIGNDVFSIQDFSEKWHIIEHNEKENVTQTPEDNEKQLVETFEDKVTIQDESKEAKPNVSETKENSFSRDSLLNNSRKFNIDLVPKLHFARGEFVQLLISSNIARYAEYRSVSRVLTWVNNTLEVVPCSRSDVFANNRVSVIEKRMLMKLLTSLDEDDDNYKDNQDKTFLEFLKEKKLTPNLIHFVLYAIARSTDTTSCSEGIASTKRFLNSLGRFGKTPFLFSMYGSGETTQAFCRLSAVFGGVFALDRAQVGLMIEDDKVTKVFCQGQEICAEHFVLGAEKIPKLYTEHLKVNSYISRAVFITESSVMPSEQEHLTLFMYPAENGKPIVTVLELGSLTGTCPKNLFLVHLTAKQTTTPQEDFKHIIDNLFQFNDQSTEDIRKPKILWSCYFSLPETNSSDLKGTNHPPNLFVADGPDLDLDYDLTIKKAKDIFKQIYPDDEFLPRAPDPEEIIFGGEENEKENVEVTDTLQKDTTSLNDNN
ncbi:rab escort protein [Rhynchophorus ferrugineus]|uniref:rab escort protein n=1 Tax=Rhynchophorus ferrugineus TaxID=354439 RepID=UPI003FCC3B9D